MMAQPRHAFLLYPRFLCADGSRPTIGGIQTYIKALAQLFVEHGIPITILQLGDPPFERVHDGLHVVGVPLPRWRSSSAVALSLWKEASRRGNEKNDFFVFCTHSIAVRTSAPRAISIQHGVSWDIPFNLLPTKGPLRALSCRSTAAAKARKAFQSSWQIRRAHFVRTLVCVDYNFPNWLRASSGQTPPPNLIVVPNCVFPQHASAVVDQSCTLTPPDSPIRIIFARRFEQYRGTRLMADVAERVLSSGRDFAITFAGDGSDLPYLQARFRDHAHVRIVTYDPRYSVEFHQQFHIAVVPSVASEGTTLSMLEAMAAGCTVVATPIGGVTNVIIDDWNGVLVEAESAQITSAIVSLAIDPRRRATLAQRAQAMTIEGPFSYNKWRLRWRNVIESLA